MKTYIGDRTIDGIVATVNGEDLPDYSEIKRYTGAGFEWGFEGHAATQLAFALLYEHSRDAQLSASLAESFMTNVTANFGNEWELTSADIEAAVTQVRGVEAK